MPEPYQTLEIERDGGVARVWLNRPRVHNAINGAMLDEVAEAFTAFQTEFGIRVIVLGGRGPSFSSGADRSAPPARPSEEHVPSARERRYLGQAGRRALEAIERVEAITIARMHGHVIGGGFVFALGCDLRIAAESTSLLVPEVELGIPLTWGAVPRLIREVGMARAKEIILLCDRFDAVTHADNVAAHALRSARRSLIVRADVNAHTQVICARANEDARCGRNVCVIATKREHDVIVADNEIVGWIKTNPPKLRA